MSDTKRSPKRLGRPTLYDGKDLEITFMIHPDDAEFIAELAEQMKCSRSDALTDCIRSCKRKLRKQR